MIALVAALAALAAAPGSPLDACSLLDGKAIAAAQGAEPREKKASEQPDGALVSRQCFFALPDFSKSVSLEVRRATSAAERKALGERWRQIADSGKEGARARDAEEERGAPPRPIKGVGKAAFWTGNQRAGALYVLGKDAIVRVSVGGPAGEPAKIKASSALAKNALAHLARLK